MISENKLKYWIRKSNFLVKKDQKRNKKIDEKRFEREIDTFEWRYRQVKEEIENYEFDGKYLSVKDVMWMEKIMSLVKILQKYEDCDKEKIKELKKLYLARLYPWAYE